MKHLITKDLPESERPYDKVMHSGAESLSDAELLAVILRTGTKDMTSVQVGQSILLGSQNSLLNIYEFSIDELMAHPGIGKVKAIELKCIAELSKRLASLDRIKKVLLNDSESVAMYYMERMRHYKNEHVILAMFDSKGMLLKDADLFQGSSTCSVISVREVFREALLCKAVGIIMLHNHPSGNPAPSSDDDRMTMDLRHAGDIMDIRLWDHIIIGDRTYYSYADEFKL